MKLSIITINYKNISGLKQTTESIKSQYFRDFEWIIIDGGSDDGSKEFIENLVSDKSYNISYWCSESDKGIYDAMNKGINHAHGEYLNFMNSGDWFASPSALLDLFSSGPSADILSCNVVYMFDTPQRYIQCKSLGNVELSGWDFIYTTLPHQGAFFKNKLFDSGIRYDESYKILSDLHLFFNLYFNYNATLAHYNDLDIACFDVNGISQMNSKLKKEERERVIRSFLSDDELEFYNKTFSAINLDVRHNLKQLGLVTNFFYFCSYIISPKLNICLQFSNPTLSAKVLRKDLDFYKKNEVIRRNRILWKLYNNLVRYFFNR